MRAAFRRRSGSRQSWLATQTAIVLALAGAQFVGAAPQIGYAYPAGGQRGTTFNVEVGGQSLRNVDGVRVSGEGVRASVMEHIRALDNDEMRDAGTFLRELVRRRWCARVMDEMAGKMDEAALPDHPWLRDLDEITPNELARLRTRLFDPKQQPNAQLAEHLVLEVAIAPDALPGDRELRVLGPDGLSNPICFQVGVLPELRERDFAGGPAAPAVVPPALLNGQITPGETDRIRLRGRTGQKLVIRLQARGLIPYLADAVPGWFQATMSLHAPDGKEVAWNDDYRFDPDPALFYEIPTDGIYELEVRDAIYRGRDDFVYRIAVGELPFVTQVFPLGGQAGTAATATVEGWNLPAEQVALDTRAGGPLIRQASVGANRGLCSRVSYAVDAWPEATEAEPNDHGDQPQEVAFPQVVNGRIGHAGDVDVFRFQGTAGQRIVAEVYARRLNSPLDSLLRLQDPTGAEVAMNDDWKDREMGLITHQADSYVRFELPRDGPYLVSVSDAQHQGGKAYAYRLRLRPAQPDFALRLVPSAINIAAGRSAPVTLHVLRKDGFEGAVDVALTDAPEGFTVSTTHIPADKDSVTASLSVARNTPRQVFAVGLEGRADIDGETVRRPVVPAEDMMQAFLWRFLVPREEFLVAITGSRPVPIIWRPLVSDIHLASTTPLRIPLGGTAQVQLEAPATLADHGGTALAGLRFQLGNQPRGVTLRQSSVAPTGVTLTFKADPNIAMKGEAANIIVEATTKVTAADEGTPASGTRRSLGVLPAIPFEIVER